MRSLVKRQPLIAFFLMAFVLTWGAGWVADTLYSGTTRSALLVFPLLLASPGPLLSALMVTGIVDGKAGVRTLLRRLTQWRVGWRWYAVALLLTPAMFLTAIYLNMWLGAPNPTAALLAAAPGMLLAFAVRLVNPLDGPMKEELGWRGYALPYLQERHSAPVASLILIALVVCWHLPLVWMGKLPAFALFGTAAATVLYGWIFLNARGSVLLTLIAHATDGLIRADRLGWEGTDASRFLVLVVAVWCVTALVVVIRFRTTMGRNPELHLEAAPPGQP